jgi:endoglycosylceramidase
MKRLAVVLAACAPAAPPSWHVEGGALVDPDGRAAILRGVNLSGSQKNAPYLDDKQPADYARVRQAWGLNAARFVMTWAAVEPAPGHYDDAYLDAVADRMGWADDAGLAVVLDMHEDIYGEGFGFDGAPRWACDASRYAAFVPQQPWYLNALDPNVEACVDAFYTDGTARQHFVDMWRHVAERLADRPAIVGFDVLNEPNWGTYPVFQFEPERLAPLYADVIAAVRGPAPHWVAFLEPSASRNGGIATKLPAGIADDVMYAPHSYDSGAESGAGFDPSHRADILDNVQALRDEATALRAGLWIGEYGGLASDPGITDYMTAQYDAAGAVAASTIYWAYDKDDGGYGMVDADGTEKPALIAALVRPYPARVAGTPGAYAFDPATKLFTFAYTARPALQPTEIVVPARAYPGGYRVSCGSCEVAFAGDTVRIETVPGDVTVTITPSAP